MQDHSVWVHGNSVRIENPENIVSSNTYGWGLDVTFRKRETTKVPDSWFHASVPSQLFSVLEDTYLVSVEILFLAIHCKLDIVHVYDGSTLIESPSWRHLDGEWRFKKGNDNNWNKYILERPHRVFCGIGVSFRVYVDTPPPFEVFKDDVRLIVASVGANFNVGSPLLTERAGTNISIRIGP